MSSPPPPPTPKKTIQDVIATAPKFSKRFEDALQAQLSDVIEDDPLYKSEFDPIDYINSKFPTEESVQNNSINLYLAQVKTKINQLQAQIRSEIRTQAATQGSPHQWAQNQTDQGHFDSSTDVLSIVTNANTQVTLLSDQITSIKQTAAPAEQLVAQICVDISALDLAKRHLQHTTSGLRNLHMLISTTTHLADAVHTSNFRVCVELIDAVDGLLTFFDPYKNIEKIKIISAQIRQLKTKICNEALSLIKNTIILNVPAHTVESFPPNSEKAIQFRDALQVIKLVDPVQELNIITQWSDAILSPYIHIFTKNQDSIGLQHIDRRLAWFRREFKRCLPIYDHVFPYGYRIWTYLSAQFCGVTREHLISYISSFSKISYYDIIKTSGLGHTTYVHGDQGKLVQIKQGRKKSTFGPNGVVPVDPLHIFDENLSQNVAQHRQNDSKKGGLLGSIATWAEQYTIGGDVKSPGGASGAGSETATLSLDDFDNDVALPQSTKVESDPIIGKVSLSNERNIPLLVNAVSKCLVFEKEISTKLKLIDVENSAKKQYQRYFEPFMEMYREQQSHQPSLSKDGVYIGPVQQPNPQGGKNKGDKSGNKSSQNGEKIDPKNQILTKIELTSIFEPYMYNLVIVERHSLLNLINQSLQMEHWVPTSLHAKPRYPTCDQLLFYIKRSLDNISKICNFNVLVLLFLEYVTALRHYVNILSITADLPYLKHIPAPYVKGCGISIIPNPSGSIISGLFANPNNRQDTSLDVITSNTGTTSTTGRIVGAVPILGAFSGSHGVIQPPGQTLNSNQLYLQQHPNTLMTIEQFVQLGICFNTCEHINDILPSFIEKLKEKLDDSTPLPPTQQNEIDIQDYVEQSLQYIKQNIYIYSAYRLFQEISMLPRVSWSPGTAAQNPLLGTGTGGSGGNMSGQQTNTQSSFYGFNPFGTSTAITNPHSNQDLLFGTNGNTNTAGDVNVYALSTSKYVKFFSAYANILFSPTYYSAYVKYLAQRLFPDLLSCIFTCRSISQNSAQQMVVDIYTITTAIHSIYNYQLDTHVHKGDRDGVKPGMSDKPSINSNGDESLAASTSILSPTMLQNKDKLPIPKDSNGNEIISIVYKYPLVDIQANVNVASVRIFLRFVKKEVASLEAFTKVISGSTPNNITNTISIYLGNDCSDDTVLSLFNVIGVSLLDQKATLQKYHDYSAIAKEQELKRKLMEEQELAAAQGKSTAGNGDLIQSQPQTPKRGR
jgi:hypothetical protein